MASFYEMIHPPRIATPADPVPPAAREQLRHALERRLGLVWTQPVQMLLEVQGFGPLAVSISALPCRSAACTWFRNVRAEGGKVVGGDLDAVSLVLSGRDSAADEKVVSAAQWFRSECGDLLPIPPDWLPRVREQAKPLLAHWCRTANAASDPLLWAAAQTVAQLFVEREVAA